MYSILKKCRRWTERIAFEKQFNSNLSGLCAVAAGKVSRELRRVDIPCVICYNSNHVFNRVGDRLVDITATQFNLPEIYVTDFPANDWFYQVDRQFRNWRQLANHQIKEGWYCDQIYQTYL